MYDRHRLSLAWLTVRGCPPVEQVRIAADAGYDATSLRLVAPTGVELSHPILGDRALVRQIGRAVAEAGITLFDGELLTLLPDTDVEAWRPAIETAAALAMPVMQITSDDGELSRAADNLGRVAEMASEHGMELAIELTRWRAMSTIGDAEALAAAAGWPNVGILLDALHLSRSGGCPADVARLSRARVLYLQLCDAPATQPVSDADCIAEARGNRLMPGEGELWLEELMSVLASDITISVETPRVGDHALHFRQRAGNAMAATRRFLDSLRTAKGGIGGVPV